ncbi:MAG: hypothetical protein KAQ92_00005, partial [Candidatus Aenigmarchaeota archaeon]|nr:hypothetical protein [Candidatus Aenigmarchaeota archaeon]
MEIDIFIAVFLHFLIGYFVAGLHFKSISRTLMKLTRIFLIFLFGLCAYGFIQAHYFLFGVIIIILLICEILYFFDETKNTSIQCFVKEFENIATSTHHTIDRQIAAGFIFLIPLDTIIYFYFNNKMYLDSAGKSISVTTYDPAVLIFLLFLIYLIPILITAFFRSIKNANNKKQELEDKITLLAIDNAKVNNGIIDLNEIAIKGKISVAYVEKILKKLKKKNI